MNNLRKILAVSALFCSGCASCPSDPGSFEAPWFYAKEPLQITAHVDSFKDLGAFIDWSDKFVSYHSVALLVDEPNSIGWKRVHLQFQGLPMLNGQHLELGQRIRFTLPAHKPDDCCGPYLSDITDSVFVEKK